MYSLSQKHCNVQNLHAPTRHMPPLFLVPGFIKKKLKCPLSDDKRWSNILQPHRVKHPALSPVPSLCISTNLQITLKFSLQSHVGTVVLLSLLLSLSHWHLLTQPPTTSHVAHGNKMSLPPQVCHKVLDFCIDKYTTGSYIKDNIRILLLLIIIVTLQDQSGLT